MKLSTFLCLLATGLSSMLGAWAGATFATFNDGLNAPIYDWTGSLLAGPDWRAELYGGNTIDSLTPAVGYNTGARVLAPFRKPGYFFGADDAHFPDVRGFDFAWLQVRVWNLGVGASYEETVKRGLGGYGQSELFYARGGDPFVPTPPALLLGLQTFSVLEIVPEPSFWALLLLTLPLAFVGSRWHRRRRANPGSPDS